jgi:site-specific recombinase XerD
MTTEEEDDSAPFSDASARQYIERFSDALVGHGLQLPSRLARLANLPLLDSYAQHLAAEKKSRHTSRAYAIAARKFIAATLPGESEPSKEEVEEFTVQEALERLDPNNGRFDLWLQSLSHLRASTVNARIAAASHLLKWLGLSVPDWVVRPARSKRLPRVLNRDELRKLLVAAQQSENPLAEVVVILLLESGLRVSELCNLNTLDVDMEDQSAQVWSGKGDKDRRVLFSLRSKEALGKWTLYREALGLRNEEALFVNGRGSRVTSRNLQKMMDSLGDSAGIPRTRLSPHVLRHNFATGLLERGADLVSIQRLMGHSNIASTRIYLEISDQTLREVYRRAQETDLFEDIE